MFYIIIGVAAAAMLILGGLAVLGFAANGHLSLSERPMHTPLFQRI